MKGPDMDAIRTEALTRAFGPHVAVDRLDLRVAEGELLALVGPDGAGKTTTMRLLAAIMDPTAGDAWVAGHHIVADAEPLKHVIGYMSQRFGLYPDLTVMENLDFYADIYGVPRHGRQAKVDRLLAFSQLGPFTRRLAGNLSGGMKQKLGLACALVHTPQVLLLDEPTNGVDPVSRREFWRILHQLTREGVTIFVSTAYLDEAERAHRIALMHEGAILAAGTLDELRRLLPGGMLEVRCANPRNAATVLRESLPGVDVTAFGDRLHVGVADPDDMSPRVVALLDRHGHAVAGIRRVEPSLEDVFLAVLASRARRQEVPHGHD